jgi:hypothetical protein
MSDRRKALLAAFVAALVANLVGVLLFFNPVTEGDSSFILVHPALGLLVYVVLSIALFDWTARQIGSAFKSGFVVAASQVILVIDLTMRGQRGWLTALAGIVLLAFTWVFVSYVYSRFNSAK